MVLVYGTRPEAIKLGPVVAELRARGVPLQLVCTGQHTDLLRGTPAETDLAGGTDLGLRSDGRVDHWLAQAAAVLPPVLADASLVVVQGDTMSALAGARAAHALGMPLAHVEAGVRSHTLDDPCPEEGFRVEIDLLADWHFAPTMTAFQNVQDEGIPQIAVTGNSGVSALARYTPAVPVGVPQPQILVTLHRREWLTGPHRDAVLAALVAGARQYPHLTFRWPLHPGVFHVLPHGYIASAPTNLWLSPPLPYRECATQLAHSLGCLTDSGGLAEDAATLGVPCVHLRHVTDRPEAIHTGVAARCDPTAEGVAQALEILTSGQLPRRASDCFGTPAAASHIAESLLTAVR